LLDKAGEGSQLGYVGDVLYILYSVHREPCITLHILCAKPVVERRGKVFGKPLTGVVGCVFVKGGTSPPAEVIQLATWTS